MTDWWNRLTGFDRFALSLLAVSLLTWGLCTLSPNKLSALRKDAPGAVSMIATVVLGVLLVFLVVALN